MITDGYEQKGRINIEAIPAPGHRIIEILLVGIHVMNWPLLTLYIRR
jgi:hypothetical protein